MVRFINFISLATPALDFFFCTNQLGRICKDLLVRLFNLGRHPLTILGYGVPRVVNEVRAGHLHRIVYVPVAALDRSCVHRGLQAILEVHSGLGVDLHGEVGVLAATHLGGFRRSSAIPAVVGST